jgi:hypothetical protein
MRQGKASDSSKVATEPRNVKEFLTKEKELSNISMREKAAIFFFTIYGLALVATLAVYFLQGFNAWGFNLQTELLKWLGGVTLGELGGLALLVYGFLFRLKSAR